MFRRENQRNVVDAVTAGEAKRVFGRIMEDICASLAEVGILSGVVDGVVVVPESAGVLVVGIVVVFVLARVKDVFSPTIPRCALSKKG